MEHLLLVKHLLSTYVDNCLTSKEILVNGKNTAILFAAQIDSISHT